jgi:hypothetical protein
VAARANIEGVVVRGICESRTDPACIMKGVRREDLFPAVFLSFIEGVLEW